MIKINTSKPYKVPSATQRVLTTARKDPALAHHLSFLTPKDIAMSRRVNKAYNKASHEVHHLKEKVDRSKKCFLEKYLKGPARSQYFSQPLFFWGGERNAVLSCASLEVLRKRLLSKGNHKSSNIGDELNIRFYKISPVYAFYAFKPTEIIKMIPRKEIGGLYKHMWHLLGCPKEHHAGKKAFLDEGGMSSSAGLKAKAIERFLMDEAIKHYSKLKNSRKIKISKHIQNKK